MTDSRLASMIVLCGVLAVQAENLVSNGSFENGISGWQFSGGLSVIGPPAFQPLGMDGTHAVCIGGADIPNSWIEQTIVVETNIEYRLTLAEAAGGDGHAGRTGIIRVDVLGGSELLISKSFTNVSPGPMYGGLGFVKRTMRFTSGSPNVTIRITDVSPNGGIAVDPCIDNVVVGRVQFELTIRVSEVEVCWQSETNRSYQLQYRSLLTHQTWTNLGEPMSGNGENVCVKDAVPPGEPQRFYRVVTVQ